MTRASTSYGWTMLFLGLGSLLGELLKVAHLIQLAGTR